MEDNSFKDPLFVPIIGFIKHRRMDVGFLLLGILLGVFLGWNIVQISIFSIFIWSILAPIPARIIILPALFFLVLIPFLLLFKMDIQAEEFAIYAYYFLVMAVIRGIIEVRSEEKNDEQTEEKP